MTTLILTTLTQRLPNFLSIYLKNQTTQTLRPKVSKARQKKYSLRANKLTRTIKKQVY